MNTFYQKLKPYLPKNKDKRINVLVLQPGQKFDYTGTSPDGKVRPSMPTEMVHTSQGPLMLHQGEGKITNPDGTVNVIPAHQLATLEKEHNIPGMEFGGVYNGVQPHVSIPGLGQSTLNQTTNNVQQANPMQSGWKSVPVISKQTTGSNPNLNAGFGTGFGGTGFGLENPLHVSIPGLGESKYDPSGSANTLQSLKGAASMSGKLDAGGPGENTSGTGTSELSGKLASQNKLQSLKGSVTGVGRQDAGGPGEKTAGATGANANEISRKIATINPQNTTTNTGTGNTGAAPGTGQYYQNVGLASMLQTSQGLNPNDRKLLNMYMQNYDASTAAGNAELISRISADPNLTPEARNMALFTLNRNAGIGRSTLEGQLATNSMARMDEAKSALFSAGKDLQATADAKTQQAYQSALNAGDYQTAAAIYKQQTGKDLDISALTKAQTSPDFMRLMDNVNNLIRSGDIDGAQAQWEMMKKDPKFAPFFQDLQEPNWTKLKSTTTTTGMPYDKLVDNWIRVNAAAYGQHIGATVDAQGNITVTNPTEYAQFRKDMISSLAYAKNHGIITTDKDGNMTVTPGSHFDLPWENPDTMLEYVDWGGKDIPAGKTINDLAGTNVTDAGGENVTYTKADGTTANLTYGDLTKVWNGMTADQRQEYVDPATGQVLTSKFIKDYSKITKTNTSPHAPKVDVTLSTYQNYMLSSDGVEAWSKYVAANQSSINAGGGPALTYLDSDGNQQTLKYGDKNFKFVWSQLNQAYPGITDIIAYNGRLQIKRDGTILNFGDNYTPPDGYQVDPNTHQLNWVGSTSQNQATNDLAKNAFEGGIRNLDMYSVGSRIHLSNNPGVRELIGSNSVVNLGGTTVKITSMDQGENGTIYISKTEDGTTGRLQLYKTGDNTVQWKITWSDGTTETIPVDL